MQELDGARVTYTHDAAYQLVGEVRSGAHGFAMTLTFDAVGNRTSKVDSSGTTTYQFNAANELTLMAPPTGAPTTSSYDPNGNLALEVTGSARTTMTWDGENRLTKLEPPTGAVEENVYKADGLRQKHVDGDGTIYFIMDEQNVLIEKNADLASAATYTQLPGIWGGVFSCKRGAGHQFLLADFQGHTRQLADTSGSVTETHYYDAWGREVWPIVGGGLYLRPFGQWGYWRDNASRLYVRARHLKPDLGRWMSRDPLGFEGGPSAYAYAFDRCLAVIDPTGMWGEQVHDRCTLRWAMETYITTPEGYGVFACPDAIRRGDVEADNVYAIALLERNWHVHFHYPDQPVSRRKTCIGGPIPLAAGTPDTRRTWYDQQFRNAENLAFMKASCDAIGFRFGLGLHAVQDMTGHLDLTPSEHNDPSVNWRIDDVRWTRGRELGLRPLQTGQPVQWFFEDYCRRANLGGPVVRYWQWHTDRARARQARDDTKARMLVFLQMLRGSNARCCINFTQDRPHVDPWCQFQW